MDFSGFDATIFHFLEELTDNNRRAWFQENKWRYEQEVREPCLAFIRAFEPRLKKLSRFFKADARRAGGSLIRIYRDTRFSKDKAPYKTNVGIQFRHEFGRDIHAPGYYVHIAPDERFLGIGVWRPERDTLQKIREAIEENPTRWRRATRGRKFRDHFELSGDSLKRAPRGFPADHPLIEDLRRTDLVGLGRLSEQDVLAKEFLDRVAESFAAGRPFMRFLCEALQVPF